MIIYCRSPKSLANTVADYLSRRHDMDGVEVYAEGPYVFCHGTRYDMQIVWRKVDYDRAVEWVAEDTKHRAGIAFGNVIGGVPHPLAGCTIPIPVKPPQSLGGPRWVT